MKTIYESGPLMKLLGQQRPPTADELTAIREIIAAHAASRDFAARSTCWISVWTFSVSALFAASVLNAPAVTRRGDVTYGHRR